MMMTTHRSRFMAHPVALAAGVLALMVLLALSLATGPRAIEASTIVQALVAHDPTNVDHIIVTTTRLSRSIIAMIVGASLAVAGALMQALTRNPLASPGVFGINAGAMFFLVMVAAFVPLESFHHMMWVAFAGAATAGALVSMLGTSKGSRAYSLKIVLAGAAVTAMFAAFTQAVLVINQDGLDSILFWLAGSTAQRSLSTIAPMLPYLFGALVCVCCLARDIDILAAGEDVAVGLGQHTGRTRLLVALAVVCLAGAAVAIAGNIGFIGLVVPHMVRRVLGAGHALLLPGCALFGAMLLLAADILSRLVIAPAELPIGAITAMIGAPVFIALIRRGLHRG